MDQCGWHINRFKSINCYTLIITCTNELTKKQILKIEI